jgi:hypothetical protein
MEGTLQKGMCYRTLRRSKSAGPVRRERCVRTLYDKLKRGQCCAYGKR